MTVRRLSMRTCAVMVLVLAVGCTPSISWQGPAGPSSPHGVDARQTISWTSCDAQARAVNRQLPREVSAECGTVTVPQDWNTAQDGKAADGRTFDLALMRIRSTRQKDRIGSVVTNPGGPGGSGVDFVPYLAEKVPGLLERFDLVGFDPRGVGQSAPVDCIADATLDAAFGAEPDPAADTAFQGAVTLARTVAEGCGAKHGDQLGLYSTEQAARDIDAIRAALGDAQLTYVGFSYGTLLGAVYAAIFGRNVRAMVLDGAVDPKQTPVESTEGQAMGFERAFANFIDWCRHNASTCPISADPRAAVLGAVDRARAAPVKGAGGREATAGWVFYALVFAMYSQDYWPALGQGIAELARGNPRVVFLLADSYAERDDSGRFKNLFDANNAVNCVDADTYPTIEQVRALQADWRHRYPVFGAPLAVGLLTCAVWPAKKDPYPVAAAAGAPPIVVVGTKGDPATPYESTAKLAELLGTGTVVTWDGEGHTAYPETTCVRQAVDTYLTDLRVPPPGLTCPAR